MNVYSQDLYAFMQKKYIFKYDFFLIYENGENSAKNIPIVQIYF